MKEVPYVMDGKPVPKRAYQRAKRRQFKEAMAALNALNLACAYLPREGFVELQKALASLRRAYCACRPWWRNA